MGWQGVGAHLGQRHPSLRAGGRDTARSARPLGTGPGGVGRAGGAPSVSAVPAGRVLRGAPTRATFKVNHPGPAPCPSPASQHLSQWRGTGGGRGSGAVNPPRVIIPAFRRDCTSAPKPAGLSPAAPSGAPRAPFSSGSRPLASPALPRLPGGDGSSSGGGAGASSSRPVTRHPGSARPHPGSSLFPRWAQCSGAASSRVELWRFRAPPSPWPRDASGSVHPAPSEPGPFLPCFSRVDFARSWEAAVRPAPSRRR